VSEITTKKPQQKPRQFYTAALNKTNPNPPKSTWLTHARTPTKKSTTPRYTPEICYTAPSCGLPKPSHPTTLSPSNYTDNQPTDEDKVGEIQFLPYEAPTVTISAAVCNAILNHDLRIAHKRSHQMVSDLGTKTLPAGPTAIHSCTMQNRPHSEFDCFWRHIQNFRKRLENPKKLKNPNQATSLQPRTRLPLVFPTLSSLTKFPDKTPSLTVAPGGM
jgi:hypothetical protein